MAKKTKRTWIDGLSFEKLEAERKRRGLTAKDFCVELNVSEGGWRLWKRGNVPGYSKQEHLLECLKRSQKIGAGRAVAPRQSLALNPRKVALEFLKAGMLDDLKNAISALEKHLAELAARA